MRFFNTAGPVNPIDHYLLDPLRRIELDNLLPLIEQKKYFVLHAPRQTGKTSCLLALRDYLNAGKKYRCVYVNVEIAQSAREDVAAAMQAIIGQFVLQGRRIFGDVIVGKKIMDDMKQWGAHEALNQLLALWSKLLSEPLVIFIDEIDALVGDTLISILRQLRTGYADRPANFPQTVILCGVRDVRDYRIHSNTTKEIITGGSAFNIKARSLRLGNFTRDELEELYAEHTRETGQQFTDNAVARAWELTRGQPWLVNALGYETCFESRSSRDRSRSITAEILDEAKEALIARREIHLDQLTDKLKEPRVRRVIESLLSGERLYDSASDEDIQYVFDLGLIDRIGGQIEIANAIYREVIPRQLTHVHQLDFEAEQKTTWYVRPDGKLDDNKLIAAFQEFFRENSEHWLRNFSYPEAGPQLLLQAFLQRIVNGGGQIEREYGLGRGRTDLMIIWKYPGGVQKIVIELKILRKSLERTLVDGLAQTWEYLDRMGQGAGHLVIFDRSERPWEEKIYRREEVYRGRNFTVWGM
ncbi:ATP-binding protein [Gammaproteobacteria bacterium]